MSSHRLQGFTVVDSGHIDGAKYDARERRATVRFKNGYVYEVHGMSQEEYNQFMDAPSQGEHYHANVKNNFHVERIA